MKKLCTFITLITISVIANAQTLTATLQQGDVITPFYGDEAFGNAYKAAEDGAIITLSSGIFKEPNSYGRIEKSITIIGSGAYGDDSAITYLDCTLEIKVDNVRVEGVNIKNIYTGNDCKNTKIIHCYIDRIENGYGSCTNTIVDRCSINTCYISGSNDPNLVIKNCFIKFLGYDPVESSALINNVIYDSTYRNFKGIVRNCVIGFGEDSKQLISPGQFYNNVFFRYDDKAEKKDFEMTMTYGNGCVHENNTVDTYANLFNGEVNLTAYPNTEAKGDDNTKVGPEGGSGFKFYPAIPRIIGKSIDRQTDAEGKINVSIQVKAEE